MYFLSYFLLLFLNIPFCGGFSVIPQFPILSNTLLHRATNNMKDELKNSDQADRIMSAGAGSVETFNNGTIKRGLKPRHTQMIALGGCVGTGLFVGTGATLALGGPAFILAAFIVMSLLVHIVVTAIVEVSAFLPVSGASMSYYAARYVSNSLGVAMGWLYVYSLGILVPYEITAGALVIDYWDK